MFGLPMIYLRIIAIAAVLGALWWLHHAVDNGGYVRGKAEVQTQFNEYRGTIQRITQQRETDNAIKAAEVRATNEATLNAYQKQLAAIADSRDSIASKLREYQDRAGRIAREAADNQPGTAPASPQPSGVSEVDASLDEFSNSCLADAAQLDALIAQIKGQM